MLKFRKKKSLLLALFFALVLFITLPGVSYAHLYSLMMGRQTYYSGVVVAYKWGNTFEPYTTAHQAALNDWNNSDSNSVFTWGYLSYTPTGKSDNRMGVTYIENAFLLGINQNDANSHSSYSYAYADLNQFAIELLDLDANWRRGIANHEIGHSMSLNDYNSVDYIIMSNQTDMEWIYRPQGDDIEGVLAAY